MKVLNLLAILLIALTFTSCDKDEDEDKKNDYDVPTTYNFENVSYGGQEQRLDMLTELLDYMKTGNAGEQLSSDKMIAMYEHSNNDVFENTYDDSKQIKNKTFEGAQEDFAEIMRVAGEASASSTPASEGVAGVLSSADGAKSYLVNANGLEPRQIVAKGLMGAFLYYQTTSVYMSDDKMDVDNDEVTEGKGTKMQHHWDESFGYFAAPKDFPANTEGAGYWSGYCNKRANPLLGTNDAIMNAFIKGRAAINNKDYETRDEAISTVRENWELVAVAAALHYLNSSSTDEDNAIKFHHLSEGIGFIYALQYNPEKKMSNSEINNLLVELVGSSDFGEMNLYNADSESILKVRDELAAAYSLEDKKENF